MSKISSTDDVTIYCENDALNTLGKVIEKYTKYMSKAEAGRKLGLSTGASASTTINKWSVHGRIPLKHLKTIWYETGYSIKKLKNFLRRDDTKIVGRYTHEELAYEVIDELL